MGDEKKGFPGTEDPAQVEQLAECSGGGRLGTRRRQWAGGVSHQYGSSKHRHPEPQRAPLEITGNFRLPPTTGIIYSGGNRFILELPSQQPIHGAGFGMSFFSEGLCPPCERKPRCSVEKRCLVVALRVE